MSVIETSTNREILAAATATSELAIALRVVAEAADYAKVKAEAASAALRVLVPDADVTGQRIERLADWSAQCWRDYHEGLHRAEQLEQLVTGGAR